MFVHSDSEDEPDAAVDIAALEKTQTVLFAQSTGPFYMYSNVPWLLQIRKEVRSMQWYKSFICVQKLSEFPCSNRIAPPCTQVRYGAITALNRFENYVLHTTMFLEKLPFCLETAVPVSCLPRVTCRHVRC